MSYWIVFCAKCKDVPVHSHTEDKIGVFGKCPKCKTVWRMPKMEEFETFQKLDEKDSKIIEEFTKDVEELKNKFYRYMGLKK